MQGSILDPSSFTIYINSIFRSVNAGEVCLNADDLKVIFKTSDRDVRSTLQAIQDEHNKVDNWCKRWSLELNTEKCGWLSVGEICVKVKITNNKNILPKRTSVTNLGVHYSYNFYFSEHISTKASRMPKFLGFLRNKSWTIVWKIYVRSIVKYRQFLVSNLPLSDTLKVEGMQREFTLKMLESDSLIDYHPWYHILGLESLWKRRLRFNLIS